MGAGAGVGDLVVDAGEIGRDGGFRGRHPYQCTRLRKRLKAKGLF
jgi:hypothetical protein